MMLSRVGAYLSDDQRQRLSNAERLVELQDRERTASRIGRDLCSTLSATELPDRIAGRAFTLISPSRGTELHLLASLGVADSTIIDVHDFRVRFVLHVGEPRTVRASDAAVPAPVLSSDVAREHAACFGSRQRRHLPHLHAFGCRRCIGYAPHGAR